MWRNQWQLVTEAERPSPPTQALPSEEQAWLIDEVPRTESFC